MLHQSSRAHSFGYCCYTTQHYRTPRRRIKLIQNGLFLEYHFAPCCLVIQLDNNIIHVHATIDMHYLLFNCCATLLFATQLLVVRQ